MPPVVGRVERHDDEVGGADGDLLLAPRAQVRLARLERVHERDFEVLLVALVAYPRNAHSSSRITTMKAAATSA